MLKAVVLAVVLCVGLGTFINSGCPNDGSNGFPCGQSSVPICVQGYVWNGAVGNCVIQQTCSTCPSGPIGPVGPFGPNRPNKKEGPNDCRVDYYWNGERCISYSNPNNCTRGRTFNWRTFTCDKVGGGNNTVRCRGDRYWNGE